MAVTTTQTNKPINPRGNDQSPKGYNRAALYSGKALDFDGVNDTLNEQTISVSSTSFAVSFYAKADNYASPLCAVSIGTSGTFDLVFYPYDDFIGNGVRIYDAQISSNLLYGVTAELGVYNMFTLQCDGEYLEVYINGQFAKKEARTYSSTYTAIKIGSILGGTQYYNGQIAGVKVYSTALTAAQVADLYNNPEKIVPTGVDNTALKLWLPMQEGAGTTAYDGSGNGNHGTISGATWTHGIGAPVSQTAVIDWNKGTNLISDSEDFSQWSNAAQYVIYSTNDTTAPDGRTTADKITEETSTSYHRFYKQIVFGTEGGSNQSYTISGFVKYIDRQYISIGLSDNSAYNGLVNFDLINGTIEDEYTYNGSTFSNKTITDVGNDWWKFSVTITSPTWVGGSIYAIAFFQESNSVSIANYTGQSKSIYVWGWNAAKENYTTSYVPTFGTAQTSPVLLPQGLTSGRDITGVNLFENVRKQGALNLDGNSWAEVHDNESLDFGSGSWTFETWIDFDDSNQKGILSRWYGSSRGALLYKRTDRISLYTGISSGAADYELINSGSISSGWKHIVGTYDSNDTKLRIYIDGSLNATSAAFANAYNSNTNPLEIGRHNDSALNSYPNQIAQPRIYNRALTAAEVLQNYNSGKSIYTNS